MLSEWCRLHLKESGVVSAIAVVSLLVFPTAVFSPALLFPSYAHGDGDGLQAFVSLSLPHVKKTAPCSRFSTDSLPICPTTLPYIYASKSIYDYKWKCTELPECCRTSLYLSLSWSVWNETDCSVRTCLKRNWEQVLGIDACLVAFQLYFLLGLSPYQISYILVSCSNEFNIIVISNKVNE